jgi:hypothetical protein
LILHELFLLYRACGNEYSKTIKASALAAGADVDFDDDDWYDPSENAGRQPAGEFEISQLPIGLGFEFS